MFRMKAVCKKGILLLFITFIVLMPFNKVGSDKAHARGTSANKEIDQEQLETYITEIINWKKASFSSSSDTAPLLTSPFLENAGETTMDWYVMGLGRTGVTDNYEDYLAMIKDVVEKRYRTEEKLSDAKATEWHRISLAILSAGGDPTNVGIDENNNNINLIADGTYDRGKDTNPLDAQGMNGWIWGLITLDSLRYEVPTNAKETRESIIQSILSKQLPDGGFALSTFENEADIDVTAMAVQALSPYYNSEETYTYEIIATGETVTKKVRDVLDESLSLLSEMQSSEGDYDLMGIKNVESTAQVIVALTALGIDPLEDDRFSKHGNTLLDGILKYRMPDGGYVHSETYDEENKTANPDESNSMASEQVLYTLVSLYRFYEGNRWLYDFRDEMTSETREKIETAKDIIEELPDDPKDAGANQVKEAFAIYEKVPVEERSYVYNYATLAKAMKQLEIENTSEPMAEHMGENKAGKGSKTSIFDPDAKQTAQEDMSKADEKEIEELLEKEVSTEHYVDVLTYIEKMNNNPQDEAQYTSTLTQLETLKQEMESVEKEVDEVNQTILNDLYPFHDIKIEDQQMVEEVIKRYDALSEYDQEKVEGYDDVKKAETQINNLIRARYIMIVVGVLIVGMSVLLVLRYKKRKHTRRKKKMIDME